MIVTRFLLRPLYLLAGKVFGLWARPTVQPAVPTDLLNEAKGAICYVLESGGLADMLALERVCRLEGMPSPSESLNFAGLGDFRRTVVLRRRRGFLIQKPSTKGPTRLRQLVDASIVHHDQALTFVPVAIYWGRSPDKERSFFKLLFSENWDVAGRTRKLFATLIHGRNTLLRYSEPFKLESILTDDLDKSVAWRKVSRILRVHFRHRRAATLGPDLSHQRTLVNVVLRDPQVQKVIEAEADGDLAKQEKAGLKARKYAQEIAAHVSYPTIRMVERFLGWLWNRIYDGIELQHVERLQSVAEDKEIVYVPCHRSHIDYLLLGYIVYHQGLSIPHTAAGINLDMPVIGSILRRGGAFFLRRSFKGNRLYAAVFHAYLHEILVRGHAIEYFVEGGRSRTGRLLQAKGGMLAMTVQSYLQDPRRPIVFVPVYFGYEKLIEGDSFIKELSGEGKKKETLLGLFRSVRSLRDNFGKVYVNVGEPIEIEHLLDETCANWRDIDANDAERPPWMTQVIDQLGFEIMSGINSAAAVTPISLLATGLLSTPKQSMGEVELERQIQLCIDLLQRFQYSESVTQPGWSPADIIAHGLRLGVISRTPHPLGDVISMQERDAVLLTYFRNNVQHLYAIPASIACCFIQGRRLPHAELQRLIRLIYPFMKQELTLQWDFENIDNVTTDAINALIDLGLLSYDDDGTTLVRPAAGSGKAFQLLLLGHAMVPMLQRFYLVIALLVRNGPGKLTRGTLEALCQQSAQRLSMIYGLNSPDFFDKALFHDFIAKLREQDVLRRNSAGSLEFDEDIKLIGEDARLVLGEEIRHSILSLTFSDTPAKDPAASREQP
ncbi:MAG: glycerol-3-phosphate 1-O-acyltransferase PlsB [Woeseia sp.]|nr:glycerol-3-phosphate 1-O-acyltransferase PlsB [Woeseia sp.]MBT8097889.1 glycerol-3-phosphate 1-O-acyltransferase PlsB [Woeseia sp.]NNE59908.1 glycerol-3-phosphate 1-O-acyltransferase PlsB [Woeseia sp.]NNL54279.1 glycerol-3-phosphate 1-O-acyltransferase PlsB [Woeseia sp.]